MIFHLQITLNIKGVYCTQTAVLKWTPFTRNLSNIFLVSSFIMARQIMLHLEMIVYFDCGYHLEKLQDEDVFEGLD